MFDAGFNFRSTSGYVTDGAGETYVLGDAYPTVRGGFTFGWDSTDIREANRRNALDRRLAGINWTLNNGSSQRTFRVDLPSAGRYRIFFALGDASTPQGDQYLQLLDDATAFLTLDDTDGTPSARWDDAAGTEHTAANWVSTGSGVYVERVFASTVLNAVLGTPYSGANSSTLAHLRILQMPTFRPQAIWFM